MVPAPAMLDYGNRTVVNFQLVPGYPFEINTGTRVAVITFLTPLMKSETKTSLNAVGRSEGMVHL